MTSLRNYRPNAGDIPHQCDIEVISANALWRPVVRVADLHGPVIRNFPQEDLGTVYIFSIVSGHTAT